MKEERSPILNWVFPRLGDLLFIGVLVVMVALGPRLINVDGDLGRHLTLGNEILSTYRIPTADQFSHTMLGQPLTPHEWLSEVIYTLFYRMMGLNGVVLLCALLIGATFLVVYRTGVTLSGLPLLSFGITLLGLAASSLHWLARPHLFTLLAVALWVQGMERARRGAAGHWWLMAIGMALWANLHGAFIAGFVILVLYGLGILWETINKENDPNRMPFLRFLGITTAASFAASLLNPAGPGLWKTSLRYLQNRYLVGHTAEYLPPDFQQVSVWPFLLMILLALVVFGLGRGKIPAAHGLLVTAWTGMGLISARNIPIYAVVAAPILVEGIALGIGIPDFLNLYKRLEDRYFKMEMRLKGFLWPVLAILVLILLFQSGAVLDLSRQGNRFDPTVFPVEAVDWVQEHPQDGNVFNYFTWGGYLLYRGWPEQLVFIDGQTDFYGEDLTREYERVIGAQDGWQAILDRYHVDWLLIPPRLQLAAALRSTPEWDVVYEDSVSLIFRRQP